MRYKLTDKGCRARPSAIQNIQSWGKVRPLLENEGIVSADRLNHACADHDYDGGSKGFIRHLVHMKWIEEVDQLFSP